MKISNIIPAVAVLLACGTMSAFAAEPFRRLPVAVYRDKMKGAWLGQMIGVGWGRPTEFKSMGAIIPDDKMPPWNAGVVNQHDNDNLTIVITRNIQ